MREAGYTSHASVEVEAVELRLGSRPGHLRLEIGDDHALEFDEEGRVMRREAGDESWRVTLDGRVLRLAGPRGEKHRRPPLDDVDRIDLLLARETSALQAFETAGLDEELRDWIARALRFDVEGRRRDRQRLREIYQPIPVLPPDQYEALVVQLTEGCPWDRCHFCNFYRGVPHRIRNDMEFAGHLDSLIDHLGRSVRRNRRVFLGQANAMLAPTDVLLRRLTSIGERLGQVPEELDPKERREWRRAHPGAIDGFYSFVDAFHRLASVDDFRALRRAGLRRLYLGLESGSPDVLELLGKPSDEGAVLELARRLHRADVRLAVIVLVGAGGRRWRSVHERKTLELLEALELKRGDQVYLSKLVVHEGEAYAERARREGIEALDPSELEESAHRLRTGVIGPAVVADYDLEQISQWSPRP